MIVNCPECQASYNLAEDLIGEEGRQVKCSQCNHQWLQKKDHAEALELSTVIPQKSKSRGLDWIVEESSVKEHKLIKEHVVKENNVETDLSLIEEEPEVYFIPELPDDEVYLFFNKGKSLLKKHWLPIVGVILFNIFWFGRFDLVEIVPQVRIVYDFLHLRSVKIGEDLVFKNITRKKIYEENEFFLEIRGYILNTGLKEQKVHLIEVQLYDEAEMFLKKGFANPEVLLLKPSFSMPFVVRINDPPKEAAHVVVTFRERDH